MAVLGSRRADPELPDKVGQYATAALAMADDFLLAAAAENGLQRRSLELLDEVLHDAIERIGELAKQRGVTLKPPAQLTEIWVSISPHLLIRALVNLLWNAVKFSPLGAQVDVSVELEWAGWVAVVISNPIDPAHAEEPLAPGFRLGLDFVQDVVDSHGGRLERDIPAQGRATVRLLLPCTAVSEQG